MDDRWSRKRVKVLFYYYKPSKCLALIYLSLRVMSKIVNIAIKAKAKAWTFEAKATGPEAKAIKFGLEAKAWPRGLHH